MFDPPVTDKGVGTAERLLVGADFAPDLLLLRVVDGILVTGEVVGPGEDRVAGLARGRVGSHAAVGAGLGVAGGDGGRGGDAVGGGCGLPVGLAAVLLELARRVEPLPAARVGAGVGSGIGPCTEGLLDDDGGGRRVVRVPPGGLARGRGVRLHVRGGGGGVGVVAQGVREAALPPA